MVNLRFDFAKIINFNRKNCVGRLKEWHALMNGVTIKK